VQDVTKLRAQSTFDLILAFDAIHDQVDPKSVLRRVYDALADDGTFYMVEVKLSSEVATNIGNPFAPLSYAISTPHCTET
jgi:hypothetical protein